MTEIWVAQPAPPGHYQLTYKPKSTYPVLQKHTLVMPDQYDPAAPNHVEFPIFRIPVIQAFHFSYGEEITGILRPNQHWLRELHLDVTNDGWNTVEPQGGGPIISQGPDVQII